MDTDGKFTTLRRRAPRRRPPRRTAPRTSVEPATFAGRLNRLFEVVHPPGRGRYANIEVVDELTARGHAISPAYLSQLRSGKRTQPAFATVCALAEFFGVRPHYFSNDDPAYVELLDDELHWLCLARDPTIRRLTTALLDLPAHLRDELLDTFLDTVGAAQNDCARSDD
jgi:transcriptional regulator with XRE-family HTH domain